MFLFIQIIFTNSSENIRFIRTDSLHKFIFEYSDDKPDQNISVVDVHNIITAHVKCTQHNRGIGR